MAKTDNATIGACGEHYVASYLSGFKLLFAMPRAGIPGSDLFVSNVAKGPAIRVQVKTGTQSYAKTKVDGEIYLWHASTKATANVSPFQWYAFVWLNGWPSSENQPKVFIVPSYFVAERVQGCVDRNEWLCFWMTLPESAAYEGTSGMNALLKCLNSEAIQS